MTTCLASYEQQHEQKLSCLVSFITVWHSLPHSSVQVVEWQSGRTDHVCVKMQQLSLPLSLFLYFLCFLHSLCAPSPFKQDAVALCTLFKGCRLANNKMPSHLYPPNESTLNHSLFVVCTEFARNIQAYMYKCIQLYFPNQ